MNDQEENPEPRDPLGRFSKGNRFWEARTTVGRPRLFADPNDLWLACLEYFKWVEDNPLWEAKAFAFQGVVTVKDMPKMRAMTIGGLCLFLDVSEQVWRDWRGQTDFVAVVTRAEAFIRNQKFTGAAADLLNANIIARDLGLADKQELTGKDGGPQHHKVDHNISPQQAYQDMLNGDAGKN
jgi:hypothetical protein